MITLKQDGSLLFLCKNVARPLAAPFHGTDAEVGGAGGGCRGRLDGYGHNMLGPGLRVGLNRLNFDRLTLHILDHLRSEGNFHDKTSLITRSSNQKDNQSNLII